MQTVRLTSPARREQAHRLIEQAPERATVKITAENRTTAQNSRFWAMLSDISRAKPGGRVMTPERWKAAIMQSFGHAVQFEMDLEGRPFPIGHSSSRLTVEQMTDLMEFMAAHFTPLGVQFQD